MTLRSGKPRAAALVCLALALAFHARVAGAVTLYDAGPVTDVSSVGRCSSIQSPSCGGTGEWTFYDDFVLASDAILTGIDFTDWIVFGTPADYVETTWSLFAADPFVSAPIASGVAAALLTPTGLAEQFLFQIGGLSVALSSGVTYWLGTSNDVGIFATTTVATVADPGGGLDASKASDGVNDLDYPFLENRAFRLEGTIVPEPSTGWLLALGLVTLAALRRGRRA